jgi:hypothetical protein
MRIKVREDGWLHRTLTEPVLKETDIYFAEQSRFTYKKCEKPGHDHCYALSPLGVLNGLFGVELQLLPTLDSSAEDGPSSSA